MAAADRIGTYSQENKQIQPRQKNSLPRLSQLRYVSRALKKQPEVMHDWNDTIWTVMIEKAIVHKDGQITFVFQNGTEIKVGA